MSDRPEAPVPPLPAPAGEGGLTSFTTRRPVAVLMVFLALVVFGFFSYKRLAVTLMPELSYPTLTVRTEYAGAAPEEVENDISRPVEEALGVVSGLQRISSISRAGVSDVVLEFAWDTEMSEASQDVLERLDQVFLPDEANRPLILHFDPSLDPVMELSLSGKGARFEGEEGLRRLRRLADLQIKRRLEPIGGVAAVRVRGGLEEEIHVLVEDEKLRRSGLPIQTVINRLAQENINVAGGTIKEGRTEYMVRTLNEYENLGQIADTVIANVDGRDVRLRDLGRVEMAHKEREIVTRTDGGESVQIDIFKEADANIVALAERVEASLGEFDPDDPEGLEQKKEKKKKAKVAARGRGGSGGSGGRGGPPGGEPQGLAGELYESEGAILQIVADRSSFIEASIADVRNSALFGGLLAIVILFLFLRNVKTTAIIAVSIPMSILMTFAPLNFLDVSLNIMSLGGLALGVGMLVDSSIVVLESIFRCREEGDDVETAAVRGTDEVKGAVTASILTSIAVFFPMVFVVGIAGQAFGDLGLAVVISLLASLVVAIFFIPMLASRRGVSFDRPGEGKSLLRGLASWRAFLKDTRSVTTKLFKSKPEKIARPKPFDPPPGWINRIREYFRWRNEMHRWVLQKPGWRIAAGIVTLPARLVIWIAAFLYFLLRGVLSLVLEIVGRLLLFVIMAFTWIQNRLLRPVVGVVFGALAWAPLKVTDALMGSLGRLYPKASRWVLRNTFVTLAATVAIFVVTWGVMTGLESELLPEVHQGELTFEASLPVGTPLEETEAILGPVERAILEDKTAHPGEIRSMILTLGFDAANSQRSDEGEHSARFKILLADSEPGTEERVIERLRGKLAQVPDLDSRVVRPVLFSSRTPIEVEVHGDDLPRLKTQGETVRQAMAGMSELADVEATLKSGAPEVQIVYDRDLLSRFGLNVRSVAELVRNQVRGFEATRFNLKDRRIPILVRLAQEDRETVDDVRDLIVNPGAERPIPLGAVAAVTLGEGPSEVRRVDGKRVSLVTANLASGGSLGSVSLGTAVDRIRDKLRTAVDWPADMTFLIAGQSEEWERSKASLWLALGLAVFLVYVIMAAQFESLIHPLVIMFTIPMAFLGTALALKLLGISLSIVVFLGMIMLAGIVVNNAIVLVDYINTLRSRGMARDEAIVTAGSVRLRPILMTTATTALGLLPMALGVGDGAEIRTPMAIAVISGLITSTVLTLLIIPAIYALLDRLKERVLGREKVLRDEPEGIGTLPDPEAAPS